MAEALCDRVLRVSREMGLGISRAWDQPTTPPSVACEVQHNGKYGYFAVADEQLVWGQEPRSNLTDEGMQQTLQTNYNAALISIDFEKEQGNG
jgi:hypothetical protein